MTWEVLERKIWRMWKNRYTLSRMARETSRTTGWSEYLSLCHVIAFLHGKKGIGFSRKQLRYAFRRLPKADIEGEESEAWAWILHLGGYEFRRGKKSTQRKKGDTPMLSPYSPEMGLQSHKRVEPISNIAEG